MSRGFRTAVMSRALSAPRRPARPQRGQRVVIARGPLSGLYGTVVSVQDSGRVTVAMDGWEPGVMLEVPRSLIARPGGPSGGIRAD